MRGHARLVGHADQRHLGLVLVERDAAHDDLFHAASFFFHNGSRVVVEAGADFEHDAEFLGDFDRPELHHLRARSGELQHLVVGDLLKLPRVGHDARIGGVDAVDVGVDLAEVGLERGGQRDGRQVRTAAAERRDLAAGRLPLKAGDDDDVAGVEQTVRFLRRDVL